MISKLSSYMKEVHLVGLHWHAIREHNSTYAIFRNLNKDCFTPDGEINLPRVIVSRGSVEQVKITSAGIDKGILTVTFDNHIYGGKGSDEFFLFVYSPALCTGRLATPVPRSFGLVAADIVFPCGFGLVHIHCCFCVLAGWIESVMLTSPSPARTKARTSSADILSSLPIRVYDHEWLL